MNLLAWWVVPACVYLAGYVSCFYLFSRFDGSRMGGGFYMFVSLFWFVALPFACVVSILGALAERADVVSTAIRETEEKRQYAIKERRRKEQMRLTAEKMQADAAQRKAEMEVDYIVEDWRT